MTEPAPPAVAPARLTAIDAYRGLVMLLMLGEVTRLSAVAKALPGSPVWRFLGRQQSHAEWAGCTLHDLIQPSFSFLVGVALPFSLAARGGRGQPFWRTTLHAFGRAAVLVALGIFLRSLGRDRTNYTFEDTLTQIGLGYGFLYLLGRGGTRWQAAALAAILVGYFALFAAYTPPAGLTAADTGVSPDWPHRLAGWEAHWAKNANAAWAFDRWFLNLFPRDAAFRFNAGGYATLSFIPTLGTMILGLFAGTVLQSDRAAGVKLARLAALGVGCLAVGWALGAAGVCPVVKRIWTPSWVLFNGGLCYLTLATFYAATDGAGWRRWAFPLVVVGMNSIAAYLSEWLAAEFVREALVRHLGEQAFAAFGPEVAPALLGLTVLAVLWLFLYALYRRGWFLKI